MLSLGNSSFFFPYGSYSGDVDRHAQETLARIGAQLDAHVFPRVAGSGIVVPSETTALSTLGTEKCHGTEAKRRSATRPRQRPQGWQGAPGGPRSAGARASVVGSGPQSQIVAQLKGLSEQYPGTQLWHQDGGMWLVVPSQLIRGLDRGAIFAIAIQYATGLVRSWGFWSSVVMPASWIGPRHTNSPDGDICAFDISDGTWNWKRPFLTLLDIYSLWAVRQLHFDTFGRWPGAHVAHMRGEKLLEFRADEYCGCSDGSNRYRDCCMSDDLGGDRIESSLRFAWLGGSSRRPPQAVARFASKRDLPPPLSELFPQ
jgi:hypothetical protein